MAKAHALSPRIAAGTTRSCLAHLIAFRLGEIEANRRDVLEQSIDGVHDMRVACRRLQAVLGVFCGFFRGKRLKRFRRSLRALIKALGNVREYDVLIEHITETVKTTSALEQTALSLLVSRYWLKREKAHARLAQVIRKLDDTETLPGFLTDLAHTLKSRQETSEPFPVILQSLIPVHLADFLAASDEVVDHPRRTDALHRFRIKGKPLRYLCELAIPCFGPAFKGYYEEIRSLIEMLGDIHDTDITLATLRSCLAEIRLANEPANLNKGMRIQTAFLRTAMAALRAGRAKKFDAMSVKIKSWRRQGFQRKVAAAMRERPAGRTES